MRGPLRARVPATLRACSLRWARTLSFAALSTVSCTAIVDWELAAGLGASCSEDAQCQGASCIEGLCSLPCDPEPCPDGSVCAAGMCRIPLDAAFILPGPVAQDDLSLSFELARQRLESDLGYLSTSVDDERFLASEASAAAEAALSAGSTVIVTARPAHGPVFADLAERHPDATVLVHGGRQSAPNLVGFDVRAYQGTYLSGIAAARKSTTKRLCYLASAVTPSIVARVNGFVLGAREIDPEIVVEVSWIGDWHDTEPPVNGQTRERRDTLAMIARGCDVVAHALDNNIPVTTVGQVAPSGVFAIGANVEDACTLAPGRCVGTLVVRWAPLLEELFEATARGTLEGGVRWYGIRASDADSPMSFVVPSNLVGAQSIAAEVDARRAELAAEDGTGSIFDGPLRSTGQCATETPSVPCVPDGERLSGADLASMCWLVEGAIRFDEAQSLDVPATVPDEGDCASPEGG